MSKYTDKAIIVNEDKQHQLDVQQKWQIVAIVNRHFDRQTRKYPTDIYDKVAYHLRLSPTIVRRVHQEYLKQSKDGILFPDLTPKPHGHQISRRPAHEPAIRQSFTDVKGHLYYSEQNTTRTKEMMILMMQMIEALNQTTHINTIIFNNIFQFNKPCQ